MMQATYIVEAACLAALLLAGPLEAQVEAPAEEESTSPTPPPAGDEKHERLEDEIEELKARLSELEAKAGEEEMEELREEALQEASMEGAAEKKQQGFFKSGARSLQELNPELSVTGDFLGTLYVNEGLRRPYREGGEHDDHDHDSSGSSGFELRTLGLSLQSYLDPYSLTKVHLGIHGGEFHLGEAYMQWSGAVRRLNITVGKFRQLFGVVNRWHQHALDQVDFPRPLTEIFGAGGLDQVGVSFDVLFPRLWAHANELTVQVTNAMNSSLFAGEFWSVPAVLGHLKSYYDLSPSTYLELGLSGLWGLNNRRGVPEEDEETGETVIRDEPWRNTAVAGADLTIVWEPLERAKYRSFTWRTEVMYLYKETPEGTLHVPGGYSYVDVRVSRVVVFGARVDVGRQPVLHGPDGYVQAAPYLTLWQSHWVKLRLQYNYLWLSGGRRPEHIVMLQVDWSAGPHKHEKY